MISFVIVANSNWGDYATPFIDSILLSGNKQEIILIDNGSKKPYTKNDKYQLIRLEQEGHYNYMKALNAGAKIADGDWLMFCNDDILCTGDFCWLEGLERVGIYGNEARKKTKDKFGADVPYIYGWMMLVHRSVWMAVGGFDEYYLHAGFDDIDFCWRAAKCGVRAQEVKPWPFIHLADRKGNKHRRAEVKDFREMQARSKAHFLEKVNNGSF